MAKVIGLTGSFGTGKTLVASVFKRLGARVLDADRIAHSACAKGKPAYREIVEVFGAGILDKDRKIDRSKLSGVVFSDGKKLTRLERIVHPHVVAAIRDGIKKAGPAGVVVVDAPLLIEARLSGIVDVLVVVTSPRKSQIERCMKKFHMERGDVLKRISSQMPIGMKIKMADFVVRNEGTRAETEKQVRKVWEEMRWR